MDLAVIKTGGKQYIVSPGEKIKIEKLDTKEGSEIVFNEVLLLKKGEKIEIGRPLIKEAKVRGRVLKHRKGKKITVLKYKPKTRYKVKKGHRQPFSEVEILKIES
jgi:large subunit ribosomal protein L21